jgi:hypothetical protein
MNYISILSTIVTFIFMVAVFQRYLRKGGTYLLFWSAGLLLYGLGTLSEVILSFTFSPLMLKIWYLSGAMLTAAWLGQGTVFLLIRKRGVAQGMAIGLGVLSLAALGLVLAAPLTSAAASYNVQLPISTQYKDILVRNGGIIALTIILNIYGTLGLVGGAIYSGFLFWRKRVLINRVLGNILIAAGALSPAMAGSFIKAGLTDVLYISEFIGVVLMYLGFIQATVSRPAVPKVVVEPEANKQY